MKTGLVQGPGHVSKLASVTMSRAKNVLSRLGWFLIGAHVRQGTPGTCIGTYRAVKNLDVDVWKRSDNHAVQ